MIATYHNHSTFSDGSASIDRLVETARALGVDELGVSDHFVAGPGGPRPRWAMPPERLAEYVRTVRAHQGGSSLVVRLGIELDWFPGHAEAIAAAIAGIDFDYIIGSVHSVNGFRIDMSAEEWRPLTVEQRDERHRQYWRCVRSMAASGLYDIAAHLDLPKKFGFRATADLSDVIGEALDAIAAASMIVELNTAGWHKPAEECYPTPEILRQCRRRDIDVTLSADAHHPEHLLRDFARGAAVLAAAGYERVARFAGREVTFDRLEDTVPR
jgi:histidinol-phosphatase (PHP family)